MDLQLPGMSGIEATRAIVAADPDIRVLVLSLFEDEDSVFLALRAGARGYVLKDADEEELTGAIRAVARGEAIFSRASPGGCSRSSPRRARRPKVFPELTEREREILGLIAAGPSQSLDRPAAVAEPEDGRQLRLGDLRQAAGGRPRGGDDPRPRGRPRRLTRSGEAPVPASGRRVRLPRASSQPLTASSHTKNTSCSESSAGTAIRQERPAPRPTVSADSHRGSAPTASAPRPSSRTKAPSSAPATPTAASLMPSSAVTVPASKRSISRAASPGANEPTLTVTPATASPTAAAAATSPAARRDPGRDPGGEQHEHEQAGALQPDAGPERGSWADAPAGARAPPRASPATRA